MSERQSPPKQAQQVNHKHKTQSNPSTASPNNTSLPQMEVNNSFSPEQIIQLQQTVGNQATRRMIAQRTTKKLIQRDTDGNIDLGGGFKGEVGVEGKIKEGAIVTRINGGGNYTLTGDAQAVPDLKPIRIW
jgi:hypothetical protein